MINSYLTGSPWGMEIFVTPNALKESTERLFPESRHRSKRILKKLIKRHGGEYRKVPVIWHTPQAIYVHPALYPALKRQLESIKDNIASKLKENIDKSVDELILGDAFTTSARKNESTMNNDKLKMLFEYSMRPISPRSTFRTDTI